MLLLCDKVTNDDEKSIRADICRYTASDINRARHEMMMLSETLIWARTFSPKTVLYSRDTNKGRVYIPVPEKLKLEKRLYEYFIKRFSKQVVEFRNGQKGNEKLGLTVEKWKNSPEERIVRDFTDYFAELNKSTDKALKKIQEAKKYEE